MTREEWDELKRGISLMKMRSVRNQYDPLGWYFQSNIHGWPKYDASAGAQSMVNKHNWHRCQHGHYFFLPWHRMYLYFFERILQRVTGNPNMTVPYWDYFDPEQRALPETFRIPPDTQHNPLYVRERCRAINSGMPLREENVSPVPALSASFFATDDRIDQFHVCHAFGGGQSQPKIIAPKQGLLERIPHDNIHMFIGGPNGFMSDECRASRDPIFWLHHSQIDRLWESWKAMGGSGPVAVDNSDQFYNQTFDFYDDSGRRKTYRVSDFMDTAKSLNYRYDRLYVAENQVKVRRNVTKIPDVFVTARQRNEAKLAIVPVEQMSIPLELEPRGRKLFEKLAKSADQLPKLRFSLQLNFNYIDSTHIYNMHMNLPNSTYPYENPPYFLGSLVYFQANCVPLIRRELRQIKKCFDITDNVKLILKQNYQFSGTVIQDINITFVPKTCDDIVLFHHKRGTGSSSGSGSSGSSSLDTMIRFNEIHLIHYFSK
ncbi:uncharacterized protein LOC128956610 [Oppia nitens]|uniref:uncharacterized protein LOC128956610 n=1 Tax=Oppia nitens TaxID=1686743 RepID=UPI0023DC197B|nr:uncharacterized protein LOC128956610 [Oppia nitens]